MSTKVDMSQVIGDYAAKNSRSLIVQAFNEMDAIRDLTFLPDIKNTMRLTTLLIDNVVKPFTSTFEGSQDSIKFIPRDINVHAGKAEFTLDPESLRQDYLAEFMKPGIGRTPADYPFERYVFDQIVAMFGSALNDETVYFGELDSSGTTARDVTDGLKKHLEDMIADLTDPIVPVNIGALDAATGYEQLRELYATIPTAWKKRRHNLTAYMSIPSYEAYQDSLDLLSTNTGRGEAGRDDLSLRGTNGILRICPATWMGDSERVFVTPKANAIIGGDSMSQDLGKINVVQNMWTADLGIAAALGTQFRHKGFIWCNEAE